MARDERELRERILSILEDRPGGMEVEPLIDRLSADDGNLSPRAVRNLLNALAEEGRLHRQRRRTSGRGAPRLVYYHPKHAAVQLMLAELVPELRRIEVEGRTALEEQDLDQDERDRQRQSQSVLQQLAESHVSEEQLAQAIIDIAPRLAEEKPVELIIEMAQWVVSDLNAAGRKLATMQVNRADGAGIDRLSAELELRLHWVKRVLQRFFRLDRGAYGVQAILDIPERAKHFAAGEMAHLDVDRARHRLSGRVIGARVIEIIPLGDCPHLDVAGTDASVADIYLEHARGSFVPPDPVSVMTAAATLQRRGPDGKATYQEFDIFPEKLREYRDTEAAVNGLVISPLFRGILPEEDFKHSRMAAMDLRQYVEDYRISMKEARWRPMGVAPLLEKAPRPSMIVRDGRIFPLVHRLRDYEDDGLYGKIVRREIEVYAQSLNNLLEGPNRRVVYAATVKSPELSWFAPLVMWYLHHRGIKVGGRPVQVEDVYRSSLADTAVPHLLFLGLAKRMRSPLEGHAFRTFMMIRRFSDIAIGEDGVLPVIERNGHPVPVAENEIDDWEAFIKQRCDDRRREHRAGRDRGAALDEDEYAPFIYLCERAAVVMGYMAPACAYVPLVRDDQGAHFLLPRFEFAVNTKRGDDRERIQRDAHDLLAWMDTGGMVLDTGHTQGTFDPGGEGGLPILVPDVIVDAHETATFARGVLGDEFTDAIKGLVAELRRRSER